MQLEIKLNSFEGPLDLLLHLIDKNKVNIYDIPIAEISRQYMEFIDAMPQEDLDLMSDFLVMGATLIQIKVQMLLPPEVDESGEEIDPREDLAERLMEYRLYKFAARQFRERGQEYRKLLCHSPMVPKEVEQYEPPLDYSQLLKVVTPQQLRSLYQEVMQRCEDRVDVVRSKFGTITREKLRVSERMTYIMSYAQNHARFSFGSLLFQGRTRMNVVVTLLACLELIKVGCIEVSQEEEFGEIYMEWNESQAQQLRKEDLTQYDQGL